MEDEGKEEKFDFIAEGEALGYIWLNEALGTEADSWPCALTGRLRAALRTQFPSGRRAGLLAGPRSRKGYNRHHRNQGAAAYGAHPRSDHPPAPLCEQKCPAPTH